MATKKKHWRRISIALVASITIILIGARLYLPYWVKDYVNQRLDELKGYHGSIADIDIKLWRGAYQIQGLKIVKDNGNIPVPFVDIATSDISVEWRALFDGAIVAEIDLYEANLNFAVSKGGDTVQAGQGTAWAHFVDTLSPLDINRLSIHGGKIAFKDFSARKPVDIFLKDLNFQVENLKDVEDKNELLPSPVRLTGNSIGGGKVTAAGKMNILREMPDFDLDIKLENAALPSINNYSRDIAAIDFESGVISLYVEAAAHNGKLTGYIKPILRDVRIVDLKQDKNPVHVLWETFVSAFAQIFKNHPKDQLALRVPFEGDLNNPQTDGWSAFLSIFKNTFNAFIRDTDKTVDFSDAVKK